MPSHTLRVRAARTIRPARATPIAMLLLAALATGCNKDAGNPGAAPPRADAAQASASDAEWPAFDAPAAPQPDAVAAPVALPRACALVEAAEAEAVLKQPVAPMSDEPENCVWASQGSPGRIAMFMVNLVGNESTAQAQTMFDAMTGMSGGLNALINEQAGKRVPTRKSGQELDGLGDAAWWSGGNADLISQEQLVVLRGTTLLQLSVTGMTKGEGTDHRAPLQAAARTALARMDAAR